jgi:predicted Fe-Mo cluster-binding NifX family protein
MAKPSGLQVAKAVVTINHLFVTNARARKAVHARRFQMKQPAAAKSKKDAARGFFWNPKRRKIMKICLPVEKPNGMNSLLHIHFGSAPFFIIFDTDSKEIKEFDNKDHVHMEGHCNPMLQFKSNPINVLITTNIGKRAITKLNEGGVKVYASETDTTVIQAIDAFTSGKLKELTLEEACGYHQGCH